MLPLQSKQIHNKKFALTVLRQQIQHCEYSIVTGALLCCCVSGKFTYLNLHRLCQLKKGCAQLMFLPYLTGMKTRYQCPTHNQVEGMIVFRESLWMPGFSTAGEQRVTMTLPYLMHWPGVSYLSESLVWKSSRNS